MRNNTTKIKLCGLRRVEDIETVNILKPDFIGFVFAQKSKRYITPDEAAGLKRTLDAKLIRTVGVFVDEDAEKVAELFCRGVIDIAQLHGNEDETYIRNLRNLITKYSTSEAAINKPIIKAFRIKAKEDLEKARSSTADYILLDAGAGDGMRFNWDILSDFDRPYFLAGGLDPENVLEAIIKLHPYGVDVSSGIETDGYKDPEKMRKFVYSIREAERKA